MGVINYELKKYLPGNLNQPEDVLGLTMMDIAYLLSQMPKGTTLYSVERLPIVDTSVRFLIKLQNKIFVDGKTLKENDEEFTRDIGFYENGHQIVEYNRSPLFNLKEVVRQYEDLPQSDESQAGS